MIRRPAIWLLSVVLAAGVPAAAQTPLTLGDAIARARAQNPDAGSTAAAERAAAARVTQARAGYLPKVDAVESWQRGNQPVFVFGSLLAQGRFTAADFALPALNEPEALDNFRAALTVEQSLFDGATKANVTAAGIGLEMAATRRTVVDLDLASGVTSAYGRVLVAGAWRWPIRFTSTAASSVCSIARVDERRTRSARASSMPAGETPCWCCRGSRSRADHLHPASRALPVPLPYPRARRHGDDAQLPRNLRIEAHHETVSA